MRRTANPRLTAKGPAGTLFARMDTGEHSRPGEEFVGERIKPVPGALTVRGVKVGEPALPAAFTWRGREYRVAEVLQKWRTTGPCRHGSIRPNGRPEQYVRKHWYRILTTDGAQMRLYFERQARSGRQRTARWWLYTKAGPQATDTHGENGDE